MYSVQFSFWAKFYEIFVEQLLCRYFCWKPLVIAAKIFILDDQLGSEYASDKPLFLYTLVEEKERYLDLLDDDFGSLVKQIEKFDELQMDILTRIDPQLLTKFDLVRANIEVWSLNVIYSCYEWIKCIYQLHAKFVFRVIFHLPCRGCFQQYRYISASC